MRDGWNTYYLLLLAGVLSLCFPALLVLISRSLRRPLERRGFHPETKGDSKEPRPWCEPERRTNGRFFLALNSGVVLVVLALVLVPIVGVFRELASQGSRDLLVRALAMIFLTGGLMIAGLLYAGRKGDLNWIRTAERDR